MSRPIKFRGKREDNREWVYGYYCEVEGRHFIIPSFKGNKSGVRAYLHTYKWRDSNKTAISGFVEIDPATLGEFTAPLDKNKVEIYEGDIVKLHTASDCPIMTVEWGGHWEYAGFGLSGEREPRYEGQPKWAWDNINPIYAKKLEVIGTIHENPELLEKAIEE